jgi:hypothetical protein
MDMCAWIPNWRTSYRPREALVSRAAHACFARTERRHRRSSPFVVEFGAIALTSRRPTAGDRVGEQEIATVGAQSEPPKRRRPDRHLRRTCDGQDPPMSGDVDTLLVRRPRRSLGRTAASRCIRKLLAMARPRGKTKAGPLDQQDGCLPSRQTRASRWRSGRRGTRAPSYPRVAGKAAQRSGCSRGKQSRTGRHVRRSGAQVHESSSHTDLGTWWVTPQQAVRTR